MFKKLKIHFNLDQVQILHYVFWVSQVQDILKQVIYTKGNMIILLCKKHQEYRNLMNKQYNWQVIHYHYMLIWVVMQHLIQMFVSLNLQYCINETGNKEMDEPCFNVSDSENQIVEIESPDISSGEEGIFQTQIKQLIPKQSSKSLKSIKKSSQQKINYQQSLKNFIAAKELISKVKQDINIGIIEEIILKKHLEETTLQQQLADQHAYLIEQRDECIRELNNLYQKLFLGGDENNEKIIKCNTPNIAQSSVTNKLKIIQTLKKRTQMEELLVGSYNIKPPQDLCSPLYILIWYIL